MSHPPPSGDDDAREAAQNVADSAESWEHGAEKSTIRDHLDHGLEEAGVEVPDDEKERLVDEVRDDDQKPIVDEATPEDR
jgi:hypothetical protein